MKLQTAGELRDSIDLFTHTVPAEYKNFLTKLMPVFLEILRGPPVFVSTSPEQVCARIPRACTTLEIANGRGRA